MALDDLGYTGTNSRAYDQHSYSKAAERKEERAASRQEVRTFGRTLTADERALRESVQRSIENGRAIGKIDAVKKDVDDLKEFRRGLRGEDGIEVNDNVIRGLSGAGGFGSGRNGSNGELPQLFLVYFAVGGIIEKGYVPISNAQVVP